MTNPWKILGQQEVYENKWIQVTEFDVINPAGGKGIYGKVHFKNLAVGVVVIDDDWNTYLVGQYRFTLDAYSWEIPEGGGDPAQPPRVSAERELLEETGLVAKEWTELGRYHLSNSVSDEEGFLFLARNLEQHAPMPEDTEDIKVWKLPFSETMAMIDRGEITDTLTIIALQKIRLMQLEGKLPS
ncbi:MAG: NUDIX domain-containing protein [Chitinophagaceae bacterium]